MSYSFYTREQVAGVLAKMSSNMELVSRYMNNTTRPVVVTENPVKNSFDWKSTREGFRFWHAVSEAFDKALSSGEVTIQGKAMSEKKAKELLEFDVEHKVEDFLLPDFIVAKPSIKSSEEDIMERIRAIVGYSTEEEDEDEEEGEEDEDFDGAPSTDADDFAKKMSKFIVMKTVEAAIRSAQKKAKKN